MTDEAATWSHGERLYRLLPAIYRLRDAGEGEPLRALMSLIEAELEALERNIEDLHENSFIETCDDWAIPYIADLLGVRGLHAISDADTGAGGFSQRAYVANTLRYRRRKGTASVLEQLARDVTGWPARVLECFQLLATTQHLNHVRPDNVRTPDLRDGNALERLGTPFENAPRSAELRHIASARGRYNIPSLGLFLWRLQSYAVTRSRARASGAPALGRYSFDPIGRDIPLFNRPRTETGISHLAEEHEAPGRLRRRALYDELLALRQGESRPSYFDDPPVFQLFVNEQPDAIPFEEILICDLSDWRRPPADVRVTRRQTQPDGGFVEQTVVLPIRAAVDPLLGRIAFPGGREPASLHVSHAYGFSADVGGGPYDRRASLDDSLSRAVDWQVGVSRDPTRGPVAGEAIFSTLSEAVQAWNGQPPGSVGVITIMDSDSYVESLTGAATIQIPGGSQLHIVAADWPAVAEGIGQQRRVAGQLAPNGLRPHIRGRISVRGMSSDGRPGAGGLVLNGLLIEGELRVLIGNLGGLRLDHCTLVPGIGDLRVNPSATPGARNDRLRIALRRCILGGVVLPDSVPALHVKESIVDRPGGVAIEAPGSALRVDASSVLGGTQARILEASDSLFMEAVVVERRQQGCVRFSYLADGSRTPRRYRCQPDLALRAIEDERERARIRARLRPSFTSEDHGHPAYMQLARGCAQEIATGGGDGAEMGVYYHLKQPQRITNLETALNEYLPFGLEAGIIFVS